jgi:cytoskeletal protein CcmA (bactofilin family)
MADTPRFARIGALLALTALLVGGAAHARDDKDGAVVIDTDDNLVLAGGKVSPARPVPENFVAAGGRVVVDQPIGRHAVAVGGSVEVRAPVGGAVRAAGGTITIDAPVAGSVAAAGGDIRVTRQGAIAHSARMFGGAITIDGRIDGDLKASAEKIVINGEVTGNVKAAAEEVVLGPGARIGGAFTYAAGSELQKGEGATIGGAVSRRDKMEDREAAIDDAPGDARKAMSVAGTVASYLVLLACGAIFIAVAPIFSVEAPDRMKASPARSLGIGLLTLVGVPLAAVLFFVTLIGIPVAMLLVALLPFVLLLGFLVGTLWAATWLPRVLKKPPPPTVRAAIGYFAISLAVVMLLGKVPSVGGVFLFVLLILGLGAFEVEMYRRLRPRRG